MDQTSKCSALLELNMSRASRLFSILKSSKNEHLRVLKTNHNLFGEEAVDELAKYLK